MSDNSDAGGFVDPGDIHPWLLEMSPAELDVAVEMFLQDTSPLIAAIRDFAGGHPYFGLWLMRVDAALRVSGLSLATLVGRWTVSGPPGGPPTAEGGPEQWPWVAAYRSGMAPVVAAHQAWAAHPKWSSFFIAGELEPIPPPPPAAGWKTPLRMVPPPDEDD